MRDDQNLNWARPPDTAISITGRVIKKPGTNVLTKFKWGFIQGMEATRDGKLERFDGIEWNVNSPVGTKLKAPAWVKSKMCLRTRTTAPRAISCMTLLTVMI